MISINIVSQLVKDSLTSLVSTKSQSVPYRCITTSLQGSNTEVSQCPVQFGYIYPVDFSNDRQRWLFGFVHHHNGGCDNLHDHPMYSASHPLNKTLKDITKTVARNNALKPAEIAQGKGIGYVPDVVGQACTNLERIARIVKKARQPCTDFDALTFESVADQADKCDIEQSCVLSQTQVKNLKKISRPYFASAIEDGIQYIHMMNLLMSKTLCSC